MLERVKWLIFLLMCLSLFLYFKGGGRVQHVATGSADRVRDCISGLDPECSSVYQKASKESEEWSLGSLLSTGPTEDSNNATVCGVGETDGETRE